MFGTFLYNTSAVGASLAQVYKTFHKYCSQAVGIVHAGLRFKPGMDKFSPVLTYCAPDLSEFFSPCHGCLHLRWKDIPNSSLVMFPHHVLCLWTFHKPPQPCQVSISLECLMTAQDEIFRQLQPSIWSLSLCSNTDVLPSSTLVYWRTPSSALCITEIPLGAG